MKSTNKKDFIRQAIGIADSQYPLIEYVTKDSILYVDYQPLAWVLFETLKEDYSIIMTENKTGYWRYTIKIDNEIFL